MRRFALATFSALLPLIVATPAHAAPAEIKGTVRDTAGHALPNTPIVLENGSGAMVATMTSDKNGAFDFPGIAAGSYIVAAMEGNAILGSTVVSVGDTGTVDKDIFVGSGQAMNVIITRQLQQARNNLSPQTGTSAYKIDNDAVENLAQGPNTSFNDVLEQAPGVAQDSFGQVHIRGEHADLQYRLNGILLPEGISGFGQVLDSRIVQSATLLTGTLPAQYGYRTAGIVDIQTKGGSFDNEGEVSMYGGSYGTIEPSATFGGTEGALNYFVSGSHLESDDGIEPATSSPDPIHDHTVQDKQFGYFSYLLNSENRLEIIAGSAIGNFQIPDNPGQDPQYALTGTSNYPSSQINERQFESNQYGAIALQGSHDKFDYQIAPYMRFSETHYEPDPVGDLIYNGIASDVKSTDTAVGLQGDGSYRLNDTHTLRAGLQLQDEDAMSNNSSLVFQGAPGAQTTFTPESIVDDSARDGQLYGVYLQDEWKITDKLTMNYGARFDAVNAFVNESQLSPRLGLVYKADDKTTLHAGYARYFTPPPMELVAPVAVSSFNGTTNAAATTQDSPVKAERTHSFDVGATHQLTNEIKLGIDGYYKLSHDLLDEGQFGQALILTPFNYEYGRVYGTEFTASYDTKDFKAYANFAISRAMGTKIVSAQFNFTDPAELAYINNNWVHLDHDQTYTASAGFSWQVLPKTAVDVDSTVGSGLRSGFANTDSLPWYGTVDLGVTEDLDLFPHDKTQLRFSIVNLFDEVYELRDGSGIGVGAPQWGLRRSFFAGVSQKF
jgi:outer membrane receptor protein involved in Fe transport